MLGTLMLLTMFAGMSVFSAWRVVRLWTRSADCLHRTATWTARLPVRSGFQRGLARGQAPLAAGVAALTAEMALVEVGRFAWGRGTAAGTRPVGSAVPAWFAAASGLLMAVFVTGLLLQFSVAWFNRPRWCVPPFLRDEPGVWQARRHGRAGGARAEAPARQEVGHASTPRGGASRARVAGRFEPEAGERIVRRAMASEQRGGLAHGGRLVLTSHRLVFVPHAPDPDGTVWASPLASVTGCVPTSRVNCVEVHFADGSRRTFVVFRRKPLLAAIRRTAGL